MIEIQRIHSKWVGECKKNLTNIFDEYKAARKSFEKDPILLFNQANRILGKRFNTTSATDKTFNSIQNILLQQLEAFEGIFMATTNLADQLDNSFDRRLLYKIEFKKPELDVRLNITKQPCVGLRVVLHLFYFLKSLLLFSYVSKFEISRMCLTG